MGVMHTTAFAWRIVVKNMYVCSFANGRGEVVLNSTLGI